MGRSLAVVCIVLGLTPLDASAQVGRTASRSGPGHDAYHFLTLMNKASIVMLAETGIVPSALASRIAQGIQQVDANEAKPRARRLGDYLALEESLLAAAGPEASRLHTGRSRQDIGSTRLPRSMARL